jgi:hypothetical protein
LGQAAYAINSGQELVFAYAVNKKNILNGEQTSAESCAKHLKSRGAGVLKGHGFQPCRKSFRK